MITAEQILYNLHMQLHPNGECKRAFCSYRGQAAKLAPLVHDMIKEACAQTAEDTRERLVAAAARAVERESASDERWKVAEQIAVAIQEEADTYDDPNTTAGMERATEIARKIGSGEMP